MKLSRASATIFLLALVGAAVGVVGSVATAEMPDWMEPYLWLAWPILAVLVVAFAVLAVIDASREQVEKPPPSVAKAVEPFGGQIFALQ